MKNIPLTFIIDSKKKTVHMFITRWTSGCELDQCVLTAFIIFHFANKLITGAGFVFKSFQKPLASSCGGTACIMFTVWFTASAAFWCLSALDKLVNSGQQAFPTQVMGPKTKLCSAVDPTGLQVVLLCLEAESKCSPRRADFRHVCRSS